MPRPDFDRKAAVAATFRVSVRPICHPRVPLAFQRAYISGMGGLTPRPRGVRQSMERRAGVRTAVLTPAGASSETGIVYLHGGGYTQGSARSHRALAAQLGARAGVPVWVPEYRLAPEHPCPAGVADALAVYASLVNDRRAPRSIVLAGDSAGGGIALGAAIAIRDCSFAPPCALVLFSPWVDVSLSGESVTANKASDAMIDGRWLRWCADAYRGDLDADDPRCSPLFADLGGLPPILVHAGTDELLRDDATRLAARVEAAGGAVHAQLLEGCGHVYQTLAGLLPEADESLDEAARFIADSRGGG